MVGNTNAQVINKYDYSNVIDLKSSFVNKECVIPENGIVYGRITPNVTTPDDISYGIHTYINNVVVNEGYFRWNTSSGYDVHDLNFYIVVNKGDILSYNVTPNKEVQVEYCNLVPLTS